MSVINVTNIKDGETVSYRLVLLKGFINGTTDRGSSLICSCGETDVAYPVFNGAFRCLAQLNKGENLIRLKYNTTELRFTLKYGVRETPLCLTPVYIICQNDTGEFQGPTTCDTSVTSAQQRIALGAQLVQCLFAEKLVERGHGRKTFQLESDLNPMSPKCRVFYTGLTGNKARSIQQEELWDHLARELMNSELGSNDRKFLAFLSCTRFDGDNVLGDAALSCGGLALLGTACLHTWPTNIKEVVKCFNDDTPVAPELLDNSCHRGTHGGCFSTTLGSACHEVGHMFNLGHPGEGIMSRGFDNMDRVFTSKSPGSRCERPPEKNPVVEVSMVRELRLVDEDTAREPNSSLRFNINKAKELKDLNTQSDDDFTFWSSGCSAILAHHKWFNSNRQESSIHLDRTRGILTSDAGLRVVQLRGANGEVRKTWEMCGTSRQIVLPRASATNHVLFAVDSNGTIFTTNL